MDEPEPEHLRAFASLIRVDSRPGYPERYPAPETISPIKMRLPKSCLLLTATAFVVVGYLAYVYVLPGAKSPLMGYDHSRQRTFDEFEIGEPKSRLLELFGEPRSIETYFSREIAYRESDFAAEDLTKCVEYVTFDNGGNWFYCFGIDENGKTVLKADGHS